MMMNVISLLRCVGLLVLGCFLQLAAGQFTESRKVSVPASWKKIFDQTNENSNKVVIDIIMVKGFRTAHRDTLTLRTTNQINFGIAAEGAFQVKEATVSVSGKFGVQQTWQSEQLTMSQHEIYASTETKISATIQPGARLIMWQLVANAAGEEICFERIIQTENPNSTFQIESATVTLLEMKQIVLGETKFRIKHNETDRFLVVVSRKNWPAGTLSVNSGYYFQIGADKAYNGYRIITMNSTSGDYNAMCSSAEGGIYFDQQYDNPKQFWVISKEPPFYIGDTVSLMNGYWTTAGLTYYEGPATTVYCLADKQDKWTFV